MNKKPKIIVILGPTATGKSDLAVVLAKKYKGEIISADSRQVYTGLDIGTGKVTQKEMNGVPHHLLDIISPKKTFTVAEWKKLAEKKIKEIVARGHTPIICGGTGLYIQSIVDNIALPEVPPNSILRGELAKKSTGELWELLRKLDERRAHDIDDKNSVRLIRAIEIAVALGSVPKLKKRASEYDFLQIGLTLSPEILQKKIYDRLLARIKKGMIAEAKNLHTAGLSFRRMNALGLEYRYLAEYLSGKLTKEGMVEKLNTEIWHYSKRQVTWFKRDQKIKWFNPKDYKKIKAEVEKFLFDK